MFVIPSPFRIVSEDVAAEEKWRAMLEDAKQENSSLQLRIVSLEDDLEAERAKSVHMNVFASHGLQINFYC